MSERVNVQDLEKEVVFTASRSGGAGGQNVNKVNTKVTLLFDVRNSSILDEADKSKMENRLSNYINKEGVLVISASEKRSQLQNKDIALQKLDKLLAKAFAKRKPRKATKPPKSAVKKRLDIKKKTSEKKQWRKNID
ncbi:alternative ribosome rescue aminoacyl-tRNA hydrolase ArfB [Cytophagaceae bacterium ABcell3]|nr:alternative ribosome rescue aminoacyl-tRNA hydrolase ArfB [Cytophagaceae bacterium ABcell3]